MSQQFYNDSIFHIEVEKIKPNPYQPRHEFNESKLRELADSIRQYGVLQPIVVTRREFEKEDGGLGVDYELIAGERRLRASKIAGIVQIPVVIRATEDDDKTKLELAIIENLQREDLTPVDRARAFKKLVEEFGFKHGEVAKKIGKSREYVSNSIRLLILPQEILESLSSGKITEGHARPLMMLIDRPEEQATLFKEIIFKKMTVREAEGIARRIAFEKVRKRALDPDMVEMEEKLTQALGTRVKIDKKENGGKILIDFFNEEDIRKLIATIEEGNVGVAVQQENQDVEEEEENQISEQTQIVSGTIENIEEIQAGENAQEAPKKDDEDLYSLRNFSI